MKMNGRFALESSQCIAKSDLFCDTCRLQLIPVKISQMILKMSSNNEIRAQMKHGENKRLADGR